VPGGFVFTRWAQLPRDGKTTVSPAIEFVSPYLDTLASSGFFAGSAQVHYDSQGRAVTFRFGRALHREPPPPVMTLSAMGLPWLDYAASGQPAPGAVFLTPSSPFFSSSIYDIELAANPFVLGWEYQSFGVWDTAPGDFRTFGGTSFGAPTPGSRVPTTGTHTFNGKLAGFYMPPSGLGSLATADLSVSANFSDRSLSFASTNTMLTRDLSTSSAAPSLDLSGTLSFQGGSEFSGTLTNSGGTMSGATRGTFYGPNAEELGGAFGLRSQDGTEQFSGAYGAKR
jgi:hypothetical protein